MILNQSDYSVFGFKSSLVTIGIFCSVYSIDHRTLTLLISHFSKNPLVLQWTLNISDVIVTGDFNLNVMKQYRYCIDEPSHFTENSISTIYLFFVTNKESVLTTGVGDPCLGLTMRYHCPVFGVFSFLNPKTKHINRIIWKYELGNYDELRNSFTNFEWGSIHYNNINIYAGNLADTISENVLKFIPNNKIVVNPQEPTWMNCTIKKEIRHRKRLFRKAKQSNNASHWTKFMCDWNKVISLIRQSKESYY